LQLAESTQNKLAIAVLKDIADEEMGSCRRISQIIKELAPDEEKFIRKARRSRRRNRENEKITGACSLHII
jgi:rubrerythrin